MSFRLLKLFLMFLVPALCFSDQFTVVFSGGRTPGSNYDRYYEETKRMYDIASQECGAENVYVLFADGADAIDMGLTMTHEIGQFAIDNDPFAGMETPGMIGENFNLFQKPVSVPEPSSFPMISID